LRYVGIWAWDGTGLGGIPLEETGVVGVVDIFAEDTCVIGITTSTVGGFTVSGLVSAGVVGVVDIFAEDTCVKGITTSSVEGFTVSGLVSDATNCGGDFGNEGGEVISVAIIVELVSKPMHGESEGLEDLLAIVVLDG
jgi:hypothetical protein